MQKLFRFEAKEIASLRLFRFKANALKSGMKANEAKKAMQNETVPKSSENITGIADGDKWAIRQDNEKTIFYLFSTIVTQRNNLLNYKF
jgi:hypothetical protein